MHCSQENERTSPSVELIACLSDDLTMLGAGNDSCHEKVEKSLKAGCDMVLICNDRNGAKQAIDFMENKDIDKEVKQSLQNFAQDFYTPLEVQAL